MRRKSKTKTASLPLPPWTPFEDCDTIATPMGPGGQLTVAETGRRRVYKNSRYQVIVQVVRTAWGRMFELSIRSLDRSARHDWRDFQRIKNEILGPEYEAVELYPAETRLVDTANQFYLYAFATAGARFPFGFQVRLVSDTPSPNTAQRPWPKGERPADCTAITQEMLDAYWRRQADLDAALADPVTDPDEIRLLTEAQAQAQAQAEGPGDAGPPEDQP